MRRHMRVPVARLQAQHERLRAELEAAFDRVLRAGSFVLGSEVEAFEQEFSRYCEVRETVAVNSGTDALILILRALDIGPGDRVAVPALTFAATAEAVCLTGAQPLVVDVEESTLTLDPGALERALRQTRIRAVIPVHLYGHPADLDSITAMAHAHGAYVIEDAAQAHGARWHGKRVGGLGVAGAFSFYPTKNLGSLGDGGAVATNDLSLARRLRQLRDHGQESKYYHTLLGMNSRLDGLQAAFLRVKLPHLEQWNARRRTLAQFYRRGLSGSRVVEPLSERYEAEAVYHQFVVRCPKREALRSFLAQRGIQTAVHYPIPVHLQPALSFLSQSVGSCPVAERAAREVLALPMYPELDDDEVRFVCETVRDFEAEAAR